MSTQKPDREALDTAQDLTATLRNTVTEVKRLRSYGRTNRRFVLIDIVLSVAIFVAGGIGVHAAQQAGDVSSTQLALCRAGNVSRAQQIGIWEFVLSLSSKKPETARERKIRVLFDRRLHRVFAPRDCAKLGQR